jgi:preprotein translocase SecE subunit
VARDRQRAKQRRRRQPGAGGSSSGPARPRPREPEVEPPPDTVFPQRGAVEPVGGEPVEDSSDDLEAAVQVEPAADELDPAVYDERAEARPGRRKRGRVLTFLGHVIDELRRVQWPDRRHTGQGTAVTLGFVVIAGAFLGLMDAIWKPLIEAIL